MNHPGSSCWNHPFRQKGLAGDSFGLFCSWRMLTSGKESLSWIPLECPFSSLHYEMKFSGNEVHLMSHSTDFKIHLCPLMVVMVVVWSLSRVRLLWPMVCSPPGSMFFQARILEGISVFSRGSSWPRNQTLASCIAEGFFTDWAIREAPSLSFNLL